MLQEIRPGRSRFKETYVRVLFFIFGRALQTLSRIDPVLRRELARWPEDLLVLYRILPKGPCMALLRNRAGGFEYRGSQGREEEAGLVLSLKNLETAFLIMTLQLGPAKAYAEHRVGVRGNTSAAVSLIRCLNVLIAYLVPGRFARKLVKRLPVIPAGRKLLGRFLIFFVGVPFGV